MAIGKEEVLEMALARSWEILEYAVKNHCDHKNTIVFISPKTAELNHSGNYSLLKENDIKIPVFEIQSNQEKNSFLDKAVLGYFPKEIIEKFDNWDGDCVKDFCEAFGIDYGKYFWECWQDQYLMHPNLLEDQIEAIILAQHSHI